MSYSDAFETPVDEVRHLIGDTVEDHFLFTDAEIAYELGKANDSVNGAAIRCVRAMMARYSSMADTTELDLSVRASQLYDHAKDLLAILSNTFLSGESVVPYAGGISRSDILSREQDSNRTVGIFDRNSPYYRRGGY